MMPRRLKRTPLLLFFLLFAVCPIPSAGEPAAQDAAPPAQTAAAPSGEQAVDAMSGDDDAEETPPQDAARYAARAAAAQSRLEALPSEIEDEALRTRVAEQWKDAAAQWQAAAQAADQYARRRQAVEGAPARLQAIQGEIEAIRAKAAAPEQADAGRSIADLEAELRELDVDLPEWNKQLTQRMSRIESQGQRLAESRRAADEAQARLSEQQPPLPGDLPPELRAATQEARTAHLRADREIVAGSDYYRNIQEPLSQLDEAERDLLSRRIEAGRARRESLSGSITDKRRDEAESLHRESEAAAGRALESLPPSFRDIAEENRELSAALDAFLAQEKERADHLQSMTGYNQTLQTDYERIRAQLAAGNASQSLGSYLWAKRRSLQREAHQADQARGKYTEPAAPGFTIGAVEEFRRRIPGLEQELAAFSAGARAGLAEQARKLLDNHSKLVGGLSESLRRRSASLVDLDAANRELHRISGRYAGLVERYVLHLPGSPPLWRISLVETFRESLADLARENLWRNTAETLARGALLSPWLLLLLLLSALPAIARRALAGLGGRLGSGARTPVAATPRGLLWRAGLAFIGAYPGPLALFAAGAAIWSAAGPGSDAAAVGDSLLAGALPWFLLNIWRHFCREDGILQLYSGMPRVLIDRLRRRLTSILAYGLPLWIAVWFVQNRTEPPAFQSFGGIVSLVLAALSVCFWRLRMRPAVFLRNAEARSPLFWRLLHLFIMALCLLWLVMSLLGYNYGALIVIAKAVSSSLIATVAVLAARCWILALGRSSERQRARAILHYRFNEERRRKREENRAAGRPSPADDGHTDGDGELDLADHGDQNPLSSPAVSAAAESIPPAVGQELEETLREARKLVRWLSLAVLAGVLLAQWSDIFPVREWLAGVVVFPRGEADGLTLLGLARAAAVAALAAAVANPLGAWANLSFFGWNPAERGTRMATSALIRYGVLGAAAVWAARELGMAWSDAQWLVAALSVGIGFGLQEIILNFVCGIILLFERPVRVGDMVTLSDAEGTISRINIRTTTIVDADHRELIIPNKELVTGRVVNWTLSDTITKVGISVGVAHGSDLDLVQRLLLEAALLTDGVLDDPAPSVYFKSMDDNGLAFTLSAYTGRLEDRGSAQHALRLAINRMFTRHGVAVPFPQLGVHMIQAKGMEKNQKK